MFESLEAACFYRLEDTEKNKAREIRQWGKMEASSKEKALEKAGGNVKEP